MTTISREEGELLLWDWLKELERRGWTWVECPGCGEQMLVSPDGTVKACGACDDAWLSRIADFYPNECKGDDDEREIC